MIILDAIPLNSPAEGWRANGVYWLRISVGATIVSGLVLVQLEHVEPEIVFARKQLVTITIGISIGCTDLLMALAEYWKFPVPYTFTVDGVPLMVIMNTLAVMTLGTADRARLKKYSQYSNMVSLQSSMTLVHPVYNALFSSRSCCCFQ